MEPETIPYEAWMCRICLGQGRYSIFEDHLLPPPPNSTTTEEEISTAIKSTPTTTLQGRRQSQVAIVDALNYFCEFKISPSETVNEPTMLCEGCCAALLQAFQFRIKLNEAECLLRSGDSLDSCSAKTGLALQLDEIEPFLDDPSPVSEDVVPPAKPPKIHHAKPRFQLTNQVSNILRHVAASSNSSGSEKRKEPSTLDSSTPKKIQRRNEDDPGRLNKTLIVPNYIFASEIGDEPVSISSNVTPSEPSEDENPGDPSSSYCQNCRKAYSLPLCLRHLPTVADRKRQLFGKPKMIRRTLPRAHVSILQRQHQVPTRPEEIPATGDKEPPEGNK